MQPRMDGTSCKRPVRAMTMGHIDVQLEKDTLRCGVVHKTETSERYKTLGARVTRPSAKDAPNEQQAPPVPLQC